MIVLRKINYNPKIDYLICKQLLNNLQKDYDDVLLKKIFWGKESPETEYQYKLLEIKRFFEENPIETFTQNTVVNLLSIICGEIPQKQTGIFSDISDIGDVELLADLVGKNLDQFQDELFQILLLKGYCQTTMKPLVPYKYLCRKLFQSFMSGQLDLAENLWKKLLFKTEKISKKHSLLDNDNAINQVMSSKQDFLQSVNGEELYLFGSLAKNHGTEYSDVDLLVVFDDAKYFDNARTVCRNYWVPKLNIPFDIIALPRSKFETLSSPGILKTLIKVGV